MINFFDNEGSMILGLSIVSGYSLLFLIAEEYLINGLSAIDKLIQSGIVGFILLIITKSVRENLDYNSYNWLNSTENESLETIIIITIVLGLFTTAKIFAYSII